VKNKIKAQKKKELALDTADHGVEASRNLYPAIELLRDPQGLAEAVLKRVQTTGANGFRFEHKLLAMNFATRLVGNHELILLNLYPFMRRYMGGHQRDVTAVLAYAVQACHEMVPPEEVHGLLQTIAHNFVTERCSGEQIAVGINACRAICARVPSSLVKEDSNSSNDEKNGSTSSVHVDVEAFARDLAGYSKHKDRSVAVAGRSWQNFVREVYPALLQGKDRGTVGSALHRNGEKPLRYGERRIAAGVKGADLLVEYETKKEAFMKKKAEMRARGEDSDDDGIGYEPMNDEDGWVDVDEEDEDDEWEEVDAEDEEDVEVAPELVEVKKVNDKVVPVAEDEDSSTIDLSKMSVKERQKLAMEVSSTRVFTAADFEKMRRLVEREDRAKRDPRAAAKMKRLRAKGEEFEELSDDSDPDSDDEGRIHTKGAVNEMDIAAESKRKRSSKIEKLEKILSGREKFEHNQREGGSTNTEKTRKKNFLMTKFSFANREKQGSKETARRGTLKKEKKLKFPDKQGNKKRRRKM
jgi:protein SDA1